ncbi:hypothetical protein COHA_007562 [Chlorella ohadii]|uniref:G-patch domain-containing protein n=1 Tax=Chlorella ohadii TaxID=2649997 RepID=A0AAD5DMV4_9CHLO|nr:hypothetical protein COHA_007562 [Chlorella ohadii]
MAEKAGGFSLSLGGAARRPAPRRPAVGEGEGRGARDGPVREEVLGFGADGGLQMAAPAAPARGPLIIPKQENSYRAGTKFKPSYIPDAADKIDGEGISKFETAEHDTAVAQQQVTYGLHVRARPAEGEAAAHANGEQRGQQDAQPPAVPADRDAAKLKEDLEQLPPEADLDAYAAMPVEQFGMALLRGMGWEEGKAIGRGTKGEVKAKELIRRPQRLGLGAAPAPEQQQKKYIKPGETREKKDLVYVDADGVMKSSKPVDEKLVERRKEGVHPGKVMRVVDGRHSGLLCEVVALEPQEEGRSDRARVRLLPSYESVTVRCKELGEKEERTREEREKERERERGGSHHDERHEGGGNKRARQRESPPPPAASSERPWLVPNIRVKVVDKRVRGGRLYLKKGTIVDVKAPTVCDVFIDDLKESVLDLQQSQLETVVPATEGTPVLVLAGSLRGKRGRLLKRNTETGLAAVQLASDFSLHKLPLDDISEWVGPADWDE